VPKELLLLVKLLLVLRWVMEKLLLLLLLLLSLRGLLPHVLLVLVIEGLCSGHGIILAGIHGHHSILFPLLLRCCCCCLEEL
jgi:hypothetical protein